jgi:GDP/UDP-N,N'-diacetylbacillosamine 2-epimerase (hydrolysing)
MKKILVVTGTRADYGLLKDLILKLQSDSLLETHVAVTGSHFSEKHGKTVDVIINDQIKNLHMLDLNISGDKTIDITKGVATGLNLFADLMEKIKFDMVVILGDRSEIWSPAMASVLSNVPVAHIHGGETTEGAVDEFIRHSVTKMSQLHFASHEDYKNRIIRMGEQPYHVWNVGAVGLDRIKKMNFYSDQEMEDLLKTKFLKKNILVTFHPVTMSEKETVSEIDSLITAMEKTMASEKVKFFISMPNSDAFSSGIRAKWEKFIKQYPDNALGYASFGDRLYLSLMKRVELVLGNSSSGILEAPFLSKAVVNVGIRQQGRLCSEHVLHSDGTVKDLEEKISFSLSDSFQSNVKSFKSIYGEGNTVQKIYDQLVKCDLEKLYFKKFYDRQ